MKTFYAVNITSDWIGGKKGGYYAYWLWKVRGLIDKMAGGAGLQRIRGSANEKPRKKPLQFETYP